MRLVRGFGINPDINANTRQKNQGGEWLFFSPTNEIVCESAGSGSVWWVWFPVPLYTSAFDFTINSSFTDSHAEFVRIVDEKEEEGNKIYHLHGSSNQGHPLNPPLIGPSAKKWSSTRYNTDLDVLWRGEVSRREVFDEVMVVLGRGRVGVRGGVVVEKEGDKEVGEEVGGRIEEGVVAVWVAVWGGGRGGRNIKRRRK